LSGKKRAHLARHFALCLAVQGMLDLVDGRSQALGIWRVPTCVLLEKLFSFVEEQRDKLWSQLEQARTGDERPIRGLTGAEAERRELRDYCDWVGRIVNQISILGIRKDGSEHPSEDEIREALNLAALTDLILVVLDCYSYKNFPVSVSGKEVELRAIRSKAQQAMDWSTLRERSRNVIDSYPIAQNIDAARKLVSEVGTTDEPFEVFIDGAGSGVLAKLEVSRHATTRILKREVEELIDLDFPLRTLAGEFSTGELLEFWALLFQIAECASCWRSVYRRSAAPLLSRAKVASLATAFLGCSLERANSLVGQFVLDPSVRNQDPFFRPLIKLNETDCLVASTFISTGRFARNLFTIAIREGRVDFSPKGLKPLRELGKLFGKAGYDVIINYPVRDSRGPVTDIDIAAVKDRYLFVGQTKVLIHPDSAYDEWKVLENLKRAAQQLSDSLNHLQSLRERLGILEGEVSVVPFVLTNVWHYTGSAVGGFKVVDFSYLENILTGGEIWEVSFSPEPTRRAAKLIEGKYPTGSELSRLIHFPLHEEMFHVPRIQKRTVVLGEWKLTVPAQMPDEVADTKREGAIAKRFRRG
jgi:hypothetical protein